MNQNLLHTPEGVRDIYGAEYEKKQQTSAEMMRVIRSYGFRELCTPTFEFFDVFSKEIGTIPSKDLYKFFDKEGNTLVLRPDFTPSMARCAAKYYMEEDVPIRFCYMGNTFINTSNLQGKLKETTQLGAELIGDDSVEADAEMCALLIESLLSAGLTEFQVSIGQVDYFRGICEAAGIDPEVELAIREAISEKNVFGAEDLIASHVVNESAAKALLQIPELFGGVDMLSEAQAVVSNERSLAAIRRLQDLYELLKLYGVDRYVSFDLGLLSKYNYYTGIVVKAYTYGVGDALVSGGRYDHLLEKFGKCAPAIGFAIQVDDLMTALESQKIPFETKPAGCMIAFQTARYKEALAKAKALRAKGVSVELFNNTGIMMTREALAEVARHAGRELLDFTTE
ncbi:MAG: ATP phosphoribosyltransferase regulatory subunit [Lachnospiraceae bacterium]|nr:ATP phosphoribosyltransferase regulatory subunit [Lachnospiraceae bacterium]